MDISPYYGRTVHREMVHLTGWVVGAGTSAPTVPSDVDNLIASTSRTSEGLYVLFLAEGVPTILHAIPTIEAASGAFKQVYVVSVDTAAKSITVQVMLAAGSGVDDIETTDTLKLTVFTRLASSPE